MDEPRPRILIVDDERSNITVLGAILETEYELSVSLDGEEVEELVAREGFDLVLLDMMMPGIGGVEVCGRLKQNPHTRETPVVFITARTDPKAIEECFAAGAVDYIPKPLNGAEVAARVRTQLQLARERARLQLAYQELNQKHEELKSAQTRLVQSERMASVGVLVAGVAHEINNPTNFVHSGAQNLAALTEELEGFIYRLAGEDIAPEIRRALEERFRPLRENLAAIREGSQRIKTIVDGLRVFSRMEDGEQVQASVVEGLMTTLDLVRATFKGQVEIVTDIQADPAVPCMPSQLNQVFMNLAINACQAIQKMHAGEDVKGRLEVSTTMRNGELAIRFGDNGPGIPERVMAQIFDPFFTTKPVGEGTGLGLSISYGIIEKHRGRIEVESAPGQGATFTVLLPA